MIDAVRHLIDNGIKWRAMPADFPPWPRDYAFFARRRDTGLVSELHERLREAVRRSQGRAASSGTTRHPPRRVLLVHVNADH
ncbi:transposase [Streptomyces sp. NPDC058694]|uniref:transposase n=1 Tax=Streptomyces sp. NPDC058694 TaxID=3346603 RepID=UPI0036487B88